MALNLVWGEALPGIINGVFGNESLISIFVQNNILLSGVLVFLAPLIVLGLVAVFFDFIVDSWKLPFAIVVDFLKFQGSANMAYVYAAIVAGPLVFYYLLKGKNAKLAKIMSVISLIFSVSLLFITQDPMKSLIVLLPINTVMMLIATVLD